MAEERRPRTQEEEAEAFERLQEQIRRMSVSDHLVYMLESLSALATHKLGFAPGGGDERDPEQARLAIDAFRALLEVAAPARPEREAAAHRQMLSELQLAYVRALESPAEVAADDADGSAAEGTGEGGSDDASPGEESEQ